MYTDVKNTSIVYMPAHALVLKKPVECVPHPPQQMYIHPSMHAFAGGAVTSLP
jgi:hypothetical protein